jgi:plastocyanin
MRTRSAVLLFALLASLAGLAAGAREGVLGPEPAVGDHLHAAPANHAAHAGHAAMGDVEMRRWADAYWATHPRVGPAASPREIQGADATVTVSGTIFNADGNAATQVDTVRISVGQSVLWQWVNGIHSITSGTGFADPNAGLVFDQPSDTFNRQFLFTFAQAETVPYFCSPHELLEMKGIVIVTAPVEVPPSPAGQAIGFVSGPWPNPSTRGASFRFALGEAGRVRADVVDARGRHVTTIVDRTYPAGQHEAAWDGRGPGGRAPAGTYWLRLRVPGFTGGRTLVLTR